MTLEQLETMKQDFIRAIHEYRVEKDFDSIELERTLDELLCKLPRDMIYVEWYDRSDIQNMADGIYDEPANDDLVDICMHELWEYNNSIMDNEVVEDIVCDSIREQHYKGE